jgi:uncharacterized RDD family membrane protein YckC
VGAFAIVWVFFLVVGGPLGVFFCAVAGVLPWLGGGAGVVFGRRTGATPGKLAVGVRIVDARTGGTPPTGRLVLRLLCYVLSAAPLYLGFLWIVFDRRKQGWHDKIAGTLVIQED